MSTRQDLVSQVARQLGVIVSRRVGMAVGVWGEPGIGKTHAARAALERLPCQHLSLHAMVGSAQIAAALPRARTLPDWAKAQLERLERGEPVEAQALAQTVAAALGASAPFVLHLEDVHEADAARLELIESLAGAVRRTRGAGLLVTSRVEPPEPFRNHRLEPLSLVDTAALLEQELKAEPPQDALEWVFARTRGNPLFALEFARYLRRQGFLWSDGERWRWREPPEGFVPVTVETLISQLVAHAGDSLPARAALEARSLIPSELRLPEALWSALAGMEATALAQARVALETQGLLRGDAFAHPLFRETIEREIPPERKRAYARRALGLLEDTPEVAAAVADGADLEPSLRLALYRRAAESAEAAGHTVQAARWLSRAADAAEGNERGRLAYRAAPYLKSVDKPEFVRLLEIAVAEDPSNTEAIIELANEYAFTGLNPEMNRVLGLLPEGFTAQAAWVRSQIALHFSQSDFVQVLRLWSDHPELHAEATAGLLYRTAFAKMELDDAAGAEALVAVALQRPGLTLSLRASLYEVRGLARRLTGELELARADMDEAVACARADGRPTNLASTLHNRQVVLEMLGLLPEMVADLREAMNLYRSAGFTFKYASSLTQLGNTLTNLGQYEEAELKLLEAHDLLVRFEPSAFLLVAQTGLCDLYLTWRPPHGPRLMQKYAQLALEHMKPLQPIDRAAALNAASRVATATGDPARGLELAERALDILNVITDARANSALAKGQALEALGRTAEAVACLERARDDADGPWLRSIEIQLALLRRDAGRAQELLGWFRERGYLSVVHQVTRKLSEQNPPTDPPLETPLSGNIVRLNVLGPVALKRGGQGVPSRARKRLELLAYLLETRIAGRSEASTLELVDAFYPGEAEPDARNALKQQVYLIRSSLGAESILSTASGYALGAVSSDAEDFLRTNDPGLWRGAYLADLGEGWREGVREALTLALRARIEALLEPDPSEAARLGPILVEMEPYDAEALRLAALALERAGSARAARAAYRKGRARLQEIGEALPEALDEFLARTAA